MSTSSPIPRSTVPFRAYLLVGLGGAGGTFSRGMLQLSAQSYWGEDAATISIWLINVFGSFVLGALLGTLQTRQPARSGRNKRLFWGTGFLGGFTTYSTFALVVVTALGDGSPVLATVYALSMIILGIAAAAAGYWVSTQSKLGGRRIGDDR